MMLNDSANRNWGIINMGNFEKIFDLDTHSRFVGIEPGENNTMDLEFVKK